MKGQKVWRVFSSASILLTLSTFAVGGACQSGVFHALFKGQEWSENYALADGVICTSPEMIDGDVNTVGKIVLPESIQRRSGEKVYERTYSHLGSARSLPVVRSQKPSIHGRSVFAPLPGAVEVTLAEKKSIRKIVIHSEKLSSFSVLVSTGGRDNWKVIKEFDNNTEKEIVIVTSVVTDKIKIKAMGKPSFIKGKSELDPTFVWIARDVTTPWAPWGMSRRSEPRLALFKHERTYTIIMPEIQEIELYGFK